MSYIETENKYETLRFPYEDNNERDYDRALAKLIKSWWDLQYFYEIKDIKDVYMSDEDKGLVALSAKEVSVLPDIFKQKAEKAKAEYKELVDENKTLASYYQMAKIITSAGSPEEGLQALEKKFGTASHVRTVANYYKHHEYQLWSNSRGKSSNDTSSWDY